jgi:hypothetical protein
VIKHILCTAVLVLGASVLRADSFNFLYSGTITNSTTAVSASGTLTTVSLGGGIYEVTAITGKRTVGQTSAGITVSPLGQNLGLLYYDAPGQSSNLDGALVFGLNGIFGFDTLIYLGNNIYQETLLNLGNPGASTVANVKMSVTHLPEPATPLLLLTMGLGIWVFMRKRTSNARLH